MKRRSTQHPVVGKEWHKYMSTSYPLVKSALAKKNITLFRKRQHFAMEDLFKGVFFQPTKVFLIIWKTSFTRNIIKIGVYIYI